MGKSAGEKRGATESQPSKTRTSPYNPPVQQPRLKTAPWAWFFVALALWLGGSAEAAEQAGGEFAELAADSVLFDEELQLLSLSGSVSVQLENIRLEADEVTYWKTRNVAAASGSLMLFAEGRSLLGESGVVDLKQNHFLLNKARGMSEVKGAQGPLYFTAEALEGTPKRLIGRQARVTSCGSQCGRDEYHLRVRRLSVLPGQKLVARKPALNIGKKRLFYWTVLVMTLNEKTDLIPKVGWNKEEGFFFKLKYLYLAREAVLGYVIYDWLQKKGTQTGMQHDWESRLGKGNLMFKQLKDTTTRRTDTNINFAQALSISRTLQGSTALNKAQATNQTFGTRTDSRNWRLALSRRAGPSNLALNINEQGNFATTSSKTRTTSLTFAKPISRNWRVNSTWNLNETQFGTTPTNQDLRGDLSLDFNQKFFTGRAHFTTFEDVDGDSYPGGGAPELTSYENLKPDLLFTFKPDVLKKLSLEDVPLAQLSIQRISRHREPTSRLYSGRETVVNASWNARRALFGASTLLTFNQQLRQTFFGTGDQNYLSTTGWQLSKKLSPAWSLNATYNESDLEGGIPLQGAQRNSSQRLQGDVALVRGPWNFRATTGFDYRLERYQPLGMNLSRRVGLGGTVTANTSRDLKTHRWSPLRATYASSQASHRLTASLSYGFGPGTLQDVTGRYERLFGEGWSVGSTLRHGKNLRGALMQDILVRKMNCCTQVQLAYRPDGKDIQLLYMINAFPGKSLTFSAADGNLDLDTNLFDRFGQPGAGAGFTQ